MTDAVLAIIIPVFRHSVLMVDAVESALAQRAPFSIAILIVNDGCPHPETHSTGLAYARAYPNRITYLRKENGGLSSARNHGISHVLSRMPRVSALYMLDADNALRPEAMARAMAALETDPQAGWIYPDIDMVGLASEHDYSGPYSVLLHTAMNICEAGSLIRRAVFEAGVIFDTSFKAGFENWDFFLTAVEAGFRGKNIEGFGFRYRKRPESMLAHSERARELILARLRAKHRALFSPRALLELEQAEAPRYAFFLSDLQEIWLTTDPLAPAEVLTPEGFANRFWAAHSAPGRHPLPPLTVVTNSEALSELAATAMLHGLLWQLETMVDQVHLAGLLAVNTTMDRMGVALMPEGSRRADEAAMLMLTTETMGSADGLGDWMASILTPAPQPRLVLVRVTLPPVLSAMALGQGGAAAALVTLVQTLRQSKWAKGALMLLDWREPDLRRRLASHMILRNRLGRQPTLPILRGVGRHMGLVLSILEFGGVEKVALNFARAFVARGWSVHLFILGSREGAINTDWRETLASVTFLADPEFQPWGGGDRHYFGTEIPRWASAGNHARLIALLHWLDVVVDLHSGAAVAVMSQLKRQGAVTVTSLHLTDRSPGGRPIGNPFLTLAYEHAFDLFAPCSLALGDWLHAMGIPEDKITPAPNAPSFPIHSDDLTRLLEARRARPAGRLRALYLGRLDPQKGLERLAEVIAQSHHLSVDWRVIGKAIVTDGAPPLPRALANLVEPALTTPDQLTQAFAEADVLILLSEYEGLPLAILEAMRQGVVPVATDVGAVSEAVIDGVNGILLPLADAVCACIEALTQLSEDRDRLARLSHSAVTAMEGRNWLTATEPMVQAIDAIAAVRLVTADYDIPPPHQLTPLAVSWDDLSRVDLTPNYWKDFPKSSLIESVILLRYQPFFGFLQFGAPEGADVKLEVSVLNKRQPNGDSARVITLKPCGSHQSWFTYELILSNINICDYVKIDWHLRYALSPVRRLYVSFMLDGSGEPIKIDHGFFRDSDNDSKIALTLALYKVQSSVLIKLDRIRLILATDGEMLNIDVLDFSVFGFR